MLLAAAKTLSASATSSCEADMEDLMTTSSPEDRILSLAQRLVELARGTLLADNPFLAAATGLLPFRAAQPKSALATDGSALLVDTAKLVSQFSSERAAPVHDYAHVLMHCVLLHPFVGSKVEAKEWSLAADIVSESLVQELLGQRPGERGAEQSRIIGLLTSELAAFTTEQLYRTLRDGGHANELDEWEALFRVDEHEAWYTGRGDEEPQRNGSSHDGTSKPQNPLEKMQGQLAQDADRYQDSPDASTQQEDSEGGSLPQDRLEAPTEAARTTWERAANSMRVDLQTLSRKRGERLGGLMRELEVGAHERVDYRDFLRQFAVRSEHLHVSDDEFDYVFYTYGLQLYRDMPLIEPLEYRDEQRIRDFVIVIDTSSSVTSRVVQQFVDATYDVLSSEASFATKVNIHIVQCDTRVQSDVKLTSLADLDRWRRSIKLYGMGGTDFRPALRYVDELLAAGEFDDLGGVIYFTDGWGTYPNRMPSYPCAFVFYDEDHRPELVPAWAIQLVMHPGQFESLSVY